MIVADENLLSHLIQLTPGMRRGARVMLPAKMGSNWSHAREGGGRPNNDAVRACGEGARPVRTCVGLRGDRCNGARTERNAGPCTQGGRGREKPYAAAAATDARAYVFLWLPRKPNLAKTVNFCG